MSSGKIVDKKRKNISYIKKEVKVFLGGGGGESK